jgi:hypothetical protein
VTSVGDRKRRSDYEVFANVSDVMDQLRAARRLAAEDPDPEVRKRASWFVRDVTWVIDMITRGAGCVVGPVWAVLRFFGKAVRGHGGAGRLGKTCVATMKVSVATVGGVAVVTAVAGSSVLSVGGGGGNPAASASQRAASALQNVVIYSVPDPRSLGSMPGEAPGRPNRLAAHGNGARAAGSPLTQTGLPAEARTNSAAGPTGAAPATVVEGPSGVVAVPSQVPSLPVAVPSQVPSLPVAVPSQLRSVAAAVPSQVPSVSASVPSRVPSVSASMPSQVPSVSASVPSRVPSVSASVPVP